MLTITQINIIKINIYLGIKLYDLYLFFYFILNLIKYILRHNIKLPNFMRRSITPGAFQLCNQICVSNTNQSVGCGF